MSRLSANNWIIYLTVETHSRRIIVTALNMKIKILRFLPTVFLAETKLEKTWLNVADRRLYGSILVFCLSSFSCEDSFNDWASAAGLSVTSVLSLVFRRQRIQVLEHLFVPRNAVPGCRDSVTWWPAARRVTENNAVCRHNASRWIYTRAVNITMNRPTQYSQVAFQS